MTLGYQVDTDPVSVPGLPDDVEDTAQIITNHETLKTPTEAPPATEAEPPVTAPQPPEKAGLERMPGAFPD